jgi:hypothetical protein
MPQRVMMAYPVHVLLYVETGATLPLGITPNFTLITAVFNSFSYRRINISAFSVRQQNILAWPMNKERWRRWKRMIKRDEGVGKEGEE